MDNQNDLVWPEDEGAKPTLRNGSKSIEDIRNLGYHQLDLVTLMQLTGYKEWIYTEDFAEHLAIGAEGHEDWCAETVLWAFDWATTNWDFERDCCEILIRAWLPGDGNEE